MNSQYSGSSNQTPVAPGAQAPAQQPRDAYWGGPVPIAPAGIQAATGIEPQQVRNAKADTFNRVAIAFMVIGLFLIGASIVPLAVYLDLSVAQGLLAFDAMLMVSALACSAYGFARSSRMMRYAGFALAIGTVAKIAVIDTWSFDSLTKAIAYIVGGVACMAIAALYSRAVKRMGDGSETAASGQDRSAS